MKRKSWTEDETLLLRRLAGTMTSTRIAVVLNRSLWSVQDKARANHIKLKTRGAASACAKYSAQLCEQAHQMHRAKVRLCDISQRLVIPYHALHSILYRRKWMAEKVELARVTPRSESIPRSKIISLETHVPGTEGLDMESTISDDRIINPLESLLEQEAIELIIRRLTVERGLDNNMARQLVQSYL